jgi:hypothetical protein
VTGAHRIRPLAASLIALAAAGAAATGCGERAAAPAPRPGDLALVRAGSERTLVLGSGPARALPAGQPAAGWRSLYTATPTGPDTTVARVDVATGRKLGSTRLSGRWTLPATVVGGAPDAATADGRTLVLTRVGDAQSRFALLDASLRHAPRTIALPGRFVFDAIAPDGGRVFLIEQRAGGHYRVRNYDLTRDELIAGAVVDKREPGEAMEGLPVARAAPGTDPWVYTLYRKPEGPFVHALNTDGWALCIDLPPEARSDAATAREWGLVLAPAGSNLYAANPALGVVVAIATGDAADVRATARFPRGAIGAAARLAMSPDACFLYVPTARGIVELDAATLTVRRTLLSGHRVSAIVASGHRLYAQEHSIVTLDANTGKILHRSPTTAPPATLAAVLQAH